MNTDTTDMLSEHLPFRVNIKHYNKTFPQDMDNLMLVLDAPTPEQAYAAASQLAAQLRKNPVFTDIYLPGIDPFFERNGLLYESVPELEQITDRLAAAQPLMAHIAGNPTLHTLSVVLTGAVQELDKGRSLELVPVLDGMSATLNARLADKPRALSWQMLFRGEAHKSSYQELLMVKPKQDFSQMFPGEQSITAVRAAAKEMGITDGSPVRLRITGEVALADEELNSSLRGMEYAGMVTFVLVGIVLYFAMRTAGMILNVVICLTLGLIFTAAFATLAVGHLNLISIAFAVLYIGLGADFAIHFLLRYREVLESRLSPGDAICRAGGDAGSALTACAITNAIGFYAFIPTDYSGVAELGIISGTGMVISLIVTLTIGSALLRYMPGHYAGRSEARRSVGKVLALSLKWKKTIYVVTFIALIAALAALPRVKFDYNLLNMPDQKGEAVRTFRELLVSPDHSPWHLIVLTRSHDETRRIAHQLEQLPGTGKLVTMLDFVPEAQEDKIFLIDQMALTIGPVMPSGPQDTIATKPFTEQRRALSELAAVLDRFVAAWPGHTMVVSAHTLRSALGGLLARLDAAGTDEQERLLKAVEQDLMGTLPAALLRLQTAVEATPFAEEDLPVSLSSRWRSESGEYRMLVYPKEDINNNETLRHFVRSVQSVAPQVTGVPVVSLEAGEAVVSAFTQAFLLALTGIVLVLLILLRSVKHTALVLVPLLLSAVFTAAFTVLLEVPFNFANIIALPLLLGLGIDSSLHMVHRSRHETSPGQNLIHTSTARAIFYSALTALVDFASLMFSSHQGTASMGILLTVGLTFTLICTLVILPALLKTPEPAGAG